MKEDKLCKCPKCGNIYTGHPAISRDDNKTEICSRCGMNEAMDAYLKSEGLERKD